LNPTNITTTSFALQNSKFKNTKCF